MGLNICDADHTMSFCGLLGLFRCGKTLVKEVRGSDYDLHNKRGTQHHVDNEAHCTLPIYTCPQAAVGHSCSMAET
jgi:hypothetical protein